MSRLVVLVVLPSAALLLIVGVFVFAAVHRRRSRYRYVTPHRGSTAFVAGRARVSHLNPETGVTHWHDVDEKPDKNSHHTVGGK